MAAAAELYVAPDGNDTSPGTSQLPVAHVERARDLIREMKKNPGLPPGGVTVILRSGTYYLNEPLLFEPQDSGTDQSPIIYAAHDKALVTLSGGRSIGGWKNVKDNLWTVDLPDVKEHKWYFRQLFQNDDRLQRARIPASGSLTTVGPLSAYATTIKRRDFAGIKTLRAAHPDAYCGFNFAPGDFMNWPDVDDAEVITFHSWECSWQTIRRIDDQTHDVFFNSPSRYPVGIFSPHCAYRIENVREALTVPGQWQLDQKSGVLSYLARPKEDPNSMQFVAPALDKLVEFKGDYPAGKYVDHITLRGITFSHANYPMGIYDIAPDWPAPMLKIDPTFPKDFGPGFSDAQAAPLCGQAIEMNSARWCTIERCEVAHIGAYGVGIFPGSSNDRVAGCYIHDAGGGGVLVRFPGRSIDRLKKEDMPHDNVVENNTIRHVSLVHPSAVGICVGQAYHNQISHNEVSDVGYAGIHLGWTWGRAPNFTRDNLIEANNVHDVMRDVVDAAGIYSLGIETGTVYLANYVHSIHRTNIAGGPTAAIYFDEGSRDIHLERNVVQDVKKVLNFNKCNESEMTWKDNYLTPADQSGAAAAAVEDVIRNAGPQPGYRR